MGENGTSQPQVGLTCWLLDTRSIWPGEKITDSPEAREALTMISLVERTNILRKFHVADAKMSLASALLKRLFIHTTLGYPWSAIRFGRKRDPKHGKPHALLPAPSMGAAPVEFNVSHQAGLVALVGCRTDVLDAELGVDIVCVNERNDFRVIEAEGLEGWVDIYEGILSAEESFDIKYNADTFQLLDGTLIPPSLLGRHDRCTTLGQHLSITLPSGEQRTFDSGLLIDAKLRRFYTFWCYKEAFIKLDGEALLARWTPQLEFKHVRAPCPGTVARCSTHGVWGERVSDAEVWFSENSKGDRPACLGTRIPGGKGKLEDTRVEIQAFEENYMIGVAAKEKGGGMLPEVLTKFRGLHLEEDIMRVARAA